MWFILFPQWCQWSAETPFKLWLYLFVDRKSTISQGWMKSAARIFWPETWIAWWRCSPRSTTSSPRPGVSLQSELSPFPSLVKKVQTSMRIISLSYFLFTLPQKCSPMGSNNGFVFDGEEFILSTCFLLRLNGSLQNDVRSRGLLLFMFACIFICLFLLSNILYTFLSFSAMPQAVKLFFKENSTYMLVNLC